MNDHEAQQLAEEGRHLVEALKRYQALMEPDDAQCVDCGAHEEQACEFDCLTRRLATETDFDENI